MFKQNCIEYITVENYNCLFTYAVGVKFSLKGENVNLCILKILIKNLISSVSFK